MAEHIGATKRLHKELNYMQKHPIPGCQAYVVDMNNIFKWKGTIMGPEGTPFENGLFKFDIQFSGGYPWKPPIVKCLTPIYHCNFNKSGNICLDILGDKWSPVLKIGQLLLCIRSLLNDPNPDDPFDHQIAKVYKKDYNKYVETAKQWTLKFAKLTN